MANLDSMRRLYTEFTGNDPGSMTYGAMGRHLMNTYNMPYDDLMRRLSALSQGSSTGAVQTATPSAVASIPAVTAPTPAPTPSAIVPEVATPPANSPATPVITANSNTGGLSTNELLGVLERNGLGTDYYQPMSESDLLSRLTTTDSGPSVRHSLSTRTPSAANPLKTGIPKAAKAATVPTAPTDVAGAVGRARAAGNAPSPRTGLKPPSGASTTSAAANSVDDLAATPAKSGGLFAPGFTDKLKAGAGGLMNPQFDWDKSSGLKGWGKDLGGYMNIANTAIQGLNAAQGLGNIADAQRSGTDLQSDILVEAMNNPTASYDLSADQQRLLDKLRNGSYDSEIGLDDVNLLGALGNAGMGALTGAGGGIPGMVIGGIGGLLNSGIGDIAAAQDRSNAELQALYAALQESNQNYRNMRRQRMMANF